MAFRSPYGCFQFASHHPASGDLGLYSVPVGVHFPPSKVERLKTSQVSMIKLSYSHSKKPLRSGTAAHSPDAHFLEGLPDAFPHGAIVVKKINILARKVVTEPWRHSFISTSRAKSRGSRTDRCRDTTPV